MIYIDDFERQVCKLLLQHVQYDFAILDPNSSDETVLSAEQLQPEIREKLESFFEQYPKEMVVLEKKLRG